MPFAPEKIRNVAFVGHRGSGKTSLAEALLFQAGAVTRLGSVADGSTVSDHDDDEKRRTMSISGSLLHAEHEGHKLNIFDAPGDPSFVADALGALRVVEGALFTVSGVAGVEVMTSRLWRRCDELEQSRVVFINHLDRDRADFAAALASIQEQLSPRCVAIAIPIGSEKDFRGVIDVLHMVAYEDAGDGSREAEPGPIPADMAGRGGDLARAPGRGRRRGLRRPHGEVPRRRGDHARTSCARPCTPRCCAASCSRWPAARRPRTRARTRCST